MLAFGEAIRKIYSDGFGVAHVWTFHEAADISVFHPLERPKQNDVVWIGNWGDEERTQELTESLRYQTAVADVLRRMSEFPADAEPVLREIMQSACRLLGSEAAAVFTLQDGKAHLAATLGWTEASLFARPVRSG